MVGSHAQVWKDSTLADTEPIRTVGFTTKVSFGIGQAAEGIKNNAFALFLLFFYVQVHGLSPSLAGTALFIALCFDAVSDPIAGYLSDTWRSRWGRRHPFMYASAVPLAVAFYFTFVPPEGLNQWALFTWLTIFTILTRAAMTLYHVPHIALGAELSDDYEERTTIVGYRTAFGIIGSLLVFASVTLFFPESDDGARGQLDNSNYPTFAAVCAIVMWVTIWISAIGTHKEIKHLPNHGAPQEPFALKVVFKESRLALQNSNFRALFLAVLVSFVMAGVTVSLNLFIFTFFWELDASALQMVLIVYPLGILVGTPLTRYFHRMFDKKPAVVWGTAWWAALQFLPVTLRLLGFFPENDSLILVPILVGVAFFQGAGVSQGIVSFGSMVADIVDEHELKTGRRQEGIFFAAVSFAAKATAGFGGLIAGFGLEFINWPTGDAIRTAADVPPETLVNLGLLYGPAVALFGFTAVWLYTRYGLNREKHAAILILLKVRRAERAAEGEMGGVSLD
ncbi:MAG: MFS transporter [Gammaproteobacteria bacterium]|nr:MFS transporter [Gammaproteobacteria bacterium]